MSETRDYTKIMNIGIINDTPKRCGVYEYGKRFSNIALKSIQNNYTYFEFDNAAECFEKIKNKNLDCIIYNHLNGTMPWVDQNFLNHFKAEGIIQGTIVHNSNPVDYFDFYLHQDPNYIPNANNYNLMRPLFEYQNHYHLPENKIKIGTFGFGFGTKNFEWICQIVNAQMKIPTELRLHLTYSFYCENSEQIRSIVNNCHAIVNNPLVNLVITHDYLSDDEILNFLAGNHLNIFMYHYYNEYNGISSSIDYALSVKRPIAICKSNMFSHIRDSNPSICVEDLSLIEIINNGTMPLTPYYDVWNHSNFSKHLDNVMGKIFNG